MSPNSSKKLMIHEVDMKDAAFFFRKILRFFIVCCFLLKLE